MIWTERTFDTVAEESRGKGEAQKRRDANSCQDQD